MPKFWPWVIALWLTPALVWGDDLQEATGFFRKMDYPKALQSAERVLKSPDSGPKELVQAYQMQGLCLAALGKPDEAVMAFRRLLSIDPSFRMPQRTSPKLTPPFFQAVGMSVDKKGITLVHNPPARGQPAGGTDLETELQSDPLGLVKSIRFRFWTEGGKSQQLRLIVTGPGKVSVKVPPETSGKPLKYTFEAINEVGGVLAQAGGIGHEFELAGKPAGPRAVAAGANLATVPPLAAAAGEVPVPGDKPAPEKERTAAPWYKTWWFWTAVGVVVAGTVVGTAVALAPGSGSGDTWQYRIVFK